MKVQEPQDKPASDSQKLSPRSGEYRDLAKRILLGGGILCILIIIIPNQWRTVYFSTTVFLIAAGAGIRIAQIIHPGKYEFTEHWSGAVKWYENLERRHQLYLNVTLCIPFLGYLYVLGENSLFIPTAALFFIYCLGVVSYDVYRIYAIISETLIGKGVISIILIIGSNLALSISGKIIGEMTHVPPATFPHTLSFLAILAIPFLLVAAGTIFILTSSTMVPFLIYGSSFAKKAPRFVKWFFGIEFDGSKNRYMAATLTFQVIFYVTIGNLTPAVLFAITNRYSQQIDLAIGRSIYEFDMYPGTECKDTFGYRQASLGDENYILASKQSTGVVFAPPRKCSL